MSFLPGRLAGREAAYFMEESRQTVNRYLEKKTPSPPSANSSTKTPTTGDEFSGADVLPEVLRHSLPSKLYYQQPLSEYSPPVSTSSKWSTRFSGEEPSRISPDVMNPLSGYLTLPQVTMGPKRWQLPEARGSVTASTANELRHDEQASLNPEKIKAVAQGLENVGKAFAVTTGVMFGSAAITFGFAAKNKDNIRVQGRDLVQPKVDSLKEQLAPLRNWVNEVSTKWHFQMERDIKEKPFVKELSRRFRAKRSEKD